MKLSHLSTPVVSAILAMTISVPFAFSPEASAQDASSKVKQASQDGQQKSIESAIERLSSTDFDTRREAAKELEARGKVAIPALKKAIKKSSDAELRWQAKRVLRRLETGEFPDRSKAMQGRKDPAKTSQGTKSAPSKLGRVKRGDSDRRRRRDLGRSRFFDLDGLDQGDFPGLDPQFAERLRKQIDGMLKLQGPRWGAMPNVQSDGRSSSLSVEVNADGSVRVVEITREDGERKRNVYEAEDMKSLLKKHPELKGRVGVTPRINFGRMPNLFGNGPWGLGNTPGRLDIQGFDRDISQMQKQMGDLQALLRARVGGGRIGLDSEPGQDRDAQVRGDAEADASTSPKARDRKLLERVERRSAPKGATLGIYVRDAIPAAIRSYLDLPEGTGLWIQEIVEGSIAEKSGLRVNDIVIKVGATKIGNATDVRKALFAKGELEIVFVRKGVEKRVKLRR